MVTKKTGSGLDDIDPVAKYKAINEKLSKVLGSTNYHPPKKGIQLDVEWIRSGLPTLDYICGGGLPKGHIMALEGTSQSGKTTLAQYIAMVVAEATGLPSAWIDVERRVNIEWMERCGINTRELALITPESAEAALSALREIVSGEEALFGVVVLDSISALIPMSATEGEVGEGQSPHLKRAKLLNDVMPQLANGARKSGTLILVINQVRDNISGYGEKTKPAGGASVLFFPSIRLDMKRTSTLDTPYIAVAGGGVMPEDTTTGIVTTITTKKNSVGHPFRKGELPFNFISGCDLLADVVNWAVTLKLIERTGSHLYYPKKDNYLVTGNGMGAFLRNVHAKKLLPQIKEEVYKLMDLEGERYRVIE